VKLRLSQLLCIAILAGAFLVISDGYAQTKTGLASYYGAELAGLPTASGEPFNPYGFTAAHNTLLKVIANSGSDLHSPSSKRERGRG
jgi:rare lipoprotein A